MRRMMVLLAALVVLPACNSATAPTQEPVLVIDSGGHTAKISDVIFTPDGRQLLSAGDDKVVRVWDVASGKVVRTLRGQIGPGDEGKLYAAALSPDGRLLAVGGWLVGPPPQCDSVRLHDFASGEVLGLLAGHENVVLDLAFSPDGRTLASASGDGTVRLWRLPGREAGPVLRGHEAPVYAVAFSPDGQRLASGSFDHTVRLWDAATGQLVKVLAGHGDNVPTVAFSPDGSSLASGSWDRTIRRWGSRMGEDLGVLARQESEVFSLAFSRDGRRLLTGAGRGTGQACHVFAVPSGREVSRFVHDNIVLATAFAPDGSLVATGGGNDLGIQLWKPNAASGTPVHRLAGDGRPVWSVAFARDGRSLAFGRTSRYRNLHDYGPLERSLRLQREGRFELSLGEAVTDEAGFQRALAEAGGFRLETPSGGSDPVLRLVRGGQEVRAWQRDGTSGVRHRSFTFSSDGRRVISGGGHGVLTVYDRESGAQVHELVGHTGDVWAVAASPDGRLLASGSDDQTLLLWDVETGRLLVSVFVGAEDEWVAWTPQGYYTASPRGDRYVGWQVNHGVDKAAEYFPVHQFRRQYYRPDVVAKALELRDPELALAEANRLRLTTTPAGPPEAPPGAGAPGPGRPGGAGPHEGGP